MSTELTLTLGFASLLAASLFSACAHTLRDFSRSALQAICEKRGRPYRFHAILKQYEDTLLAVEIVLALLLLGIALLAVTWLANDIVSSREAVPFWLETVAEISLMIVAYVLAIVVIPWTAARAAGESLLYACWPPLHLLRLGLRPVIALLRRFDRMFHRILGVQEPTESNSASITEEIRSVVDEGRREGIIESDAGNMIHRVMELQEADVADVMTPRTDMIVLSVETPLALAREIILREGHSRIPVVGDTTDDILGVLYARDMLRYFGSEAEPTASLRDIIRDPLYVPETTGVVKLLERMKLERVHMAIAVDEYGGVAGLVTMEDILEKIVGDIVDEHDLAQENGIQILGQGLVESEAWVPVSELNEQLNLDLPENEDFDTLSGFVYSRLGHVPKVGEAFVWKQLRVTVLAADKRKIDRVKLEIDQTLPSATE